MATTDIFLACSRGVAPFLKKEVVNLGFSVIAEATSGLTVRGSMADAMQLNLRLRTCQRVLLQVDSFRAESPDELYRRVASFAWEDLLLPDGYLCITSTVDTPSIRDTRYANLKCKDAIVDRMKEKTGRRPDSGPDRAHAVIHLRWKGDDCSLFIDTSGESLSKRGYRKIPMAAPMQETLAAAVLMASGWDRTGPLVNPMCGSGTIAVEAALMVMNRQPGMLRENFGFMHIRGYRPRLWQEMKERAREEEQRAASCRIIASDRNAKAVAAARSNAEEAGVKGLIEFSISDFAETPLPDTAGTVIMNPEYGERMGLADELGEIYRRIGDFFKRRCVGYRGYIFTGNLQLAKKVGLRTRSRLTFFNGPIECRLLAYDLYEGSR